MAGVIESLLFSSLLHSPNLSTPLISSISNLSKSKPLVQGKVILVQLVQVKACPSQGLSKSRLVQVKAACQRLLVQGRVTCPSQGCYYSGLVRLACQRLLVQVKATCQ